MRLRRLPLVAAPIVLALFAVPPPVSAATATVGIDNHKNTFVNTSPGQPASPKPVTTIALGEGVQFNNNPMLLAAAGLDGGPGQHNVVWDAGDFRTYPSDALSSSPWVSNPYSFRKPGVYRYFCSFHGSPGGIDMAGKVLVLKADGSVPVAPSIGRIASTSGRGSVNLRFTSSTVGIVKGRLARKQGRSFRSFGSLTLSLRKGSNSLTVRRSSSGRLAVGAYRLALTFSDGVSSNLTTARTLNFTIRR
jgi:plastocyanin